MNSKKVIVIGGGAAGFFAAINTAQKHPSYQVIILEKGTKLLSKVRVSGGGRCNITHACYDNSALMKNYPRGEKELRSPFSRFSTTDTIDWFKKRGVELKTESDGRMFPVSNSSETIINCLMGEAEKANVIIKTNTSVRELINNDDNTLSLKTADGNILDCDYLIVATGGNANKKAYDWLKNAGHSIEPPLPSLFTFNIPNNPITELMGLSVENAKIKIQTTKLVSEGPLLITHWGLSGPAILKASAWGAKELNTRDYNFIVAINWSGNLTELKTKAIYDNERLVNPAKLVIKANPIKFPKRLWEFFINKASIPSNARWADLTKKQINKLISLVINDEYTVKGKTTFKEEFVTCGGISLKEINFSTMQSKIIPNLYFAGEVIDVDGITGGFNFQNAWSTAWVAANNI